MNQKYNTIKCIKYLNVNNKIKSIKSKKYNSFEIEILFSNENCFKIIFIILSQTTPPTCN